MQFTAAALMQQLTQAYYAVLLIYGLRLAIMIDVYRKTRRWPKIVRDAI